MSTLLLYLYSKNSLIRVTLRISKEAFKKCQRQLLSLTEIGQKYTM